MQDLAKKFENLTIQSDFIFKKVMSRKRICIHLLEELLQIKIADINYIEAEKSLEPDYTSRGIRLDIIVEDDKNTHYNLEMQVKNNKNPHTKAFVLPKRSRYYQALLDIDLLQQGQEYDLLPPTYVIFICVFDFFTKGNYAQYRLVANFLSSLSNPPNCQTIWNISSHVELISSCDTVTMLSIAGPM